MAEKTLNTRILHKHDTSANWSSALNFVPKKGEIIVYDDYATINDGGNISYVPGVKIGDGTTRVNALKFVTDSVANDLLNHINDSSAHVSAEERAFWNEKISCSISGDNLIFTTE